MGTGRVSTRMMSEPLTEQSIQRRLDHFFASWKYNVDGLYVFGWESDKLIWTKSGYIYEFEIKVSRADFRNDFKNKKEKHLILKGPTEEERFMPHFYESYEHNRHLYSSFEDYVSRVSPDSRDLIANHRRPNYFYYAVPEGLIQPEEVPEYAGLIWILKEYRDVRAAYTVPKQAPVLHKRKYKDGELNLAEKFWYNWQTDRRLRCDAQRETEDVRRLLREELESRGQEMTYRQMEIRLKNTLDYQQKYYDICRDRNIDRMIIRRMRKELKNLNPNFDYDALERQCEGCYGI